MSLLPGMADTGQLPGMEAARLHLADHGQVIEIRRGDYTITAYRKDDPGLRNLAIISLTESGVPGQDVAALFGMTPVQVSRIRGEYRKHGSAGLARKRGPPAPPTTPPGRPSRLRAGARGPPGGAPPPTRGARPPHGATRL